ncbi:MAG TPA: hypothetical protein VGF67_16765, partial [Ktedonobacteraceae bacterium]
HLKTLVSALHSAHTHGIAQGDLRPQIILLTRENTCLLTGFVIEALILKRDRQLAPEHQQEQASPAADQYWLAVLV